ncbi:MAG TPA: HAMP domain-containing sensor histidine kinase, partial [Geothermobacteraceae bacterium]|nr:HAMP domain-containing sensor histidine kinase [Geothermobacteraceae bacterium]
MTKSKLIILAWLLLLIPTLLLGLGALRLLQSEEARLADSSRETARDRALAIAGNIDLAVSEVKDGLQETLRSLPQQNLAEQLDAWKRSNPLVRNAFIWQQGRGLVFPDPKQPASDEEAIFIRRYLTLFADQSSWNAPSSEEAPKPAPAVSKVFAERQELRQLAKRAPVAAESSADSLVSSGIAAAPAPAAAPLAQTGQSGWRSWYTDDQLHLLGWFAPDSGRLRYGLEIEMMGLISRLLGNLPATPPPGEAYQLRDGSGRLIHQTGQVDSSAAQTPLASAPISSLPHWQVSVYRQTAAGGTGGVMIVGSLLIGSFCIAILLGGSLLLWQAWRHQRDAQQKSSFVANISHELKTPLTTIRMYAEMLGEGAIREPEKQRRYLQTIVRESQRLTRLVGNVLDFSRLEQGRKEYASEAIELGEWLPQLLATQQVRLSEAGMQLELALSPPDEPLETDRDALAQIVLNLIDNAIKYAAEGGVLQLTLAATPDGIELHCADRGPGIPPTHQ